MGQPQVRVAVVEPERDGVVFVGQAEDSRLPLGVRHRPSVKRKIVEENGDLHDAALEHGDKRPERRRRAR